MPYVLLALHPALLSSFGVVAMGAVDLRRALIFVICLVLAIGVHEFAHAFVAHKLGDPTPEGEGRLTLNPIAHADPVGTLLLPVVLALSNSAFFFGWGRPVNTQPRHYTRKISMRAGMALVAFAGPLSNLLLAALTLAGVWIAKVAGVGIGELSRENPVVAFFTLNILLFVFNLIPLHPLDGGKVLSWFLGPAGRRTDEFLERYGFMILIGLIFILPMLGLPVLQMILSPVFELGLTALLAVAT